jgi:hypothetical protein
VIRVLAALLAFSAMDETMEAKEQECQFVRLDPDGALVVRIAGMERRAEVFGVVVQNPPPALYVDIVGQRIHSRKMPLRCVVRSTRDGQLRAQFLYFAWQDKSGDVWEDLAITLLDQGVVRVSDEQFPERAEYERHQRR